MDGSSKDDEIRIMEGWLYRIRSNKFGFQYSRKRYYVLQNHLLKSFTSVPISIHNDPVRTAFVNSCSCVMESGKKSIRGKVFFIFTLCGISSNGVSVKLGARNPEEAAKWVEAFQKVSLKMTQNPLSLVSIKDHKAADVASYWTIFGCHNGLRLFKETRNEYDQNKVVHPAIAAMSVIDGAPEVVFQILMSLGSTRLEWDFYLKKGSVIESIDGQTDIIHKHLNGDWLPWGMKPRDLLLQRYWSREEDGTYVILYHSVLHKKCPPQKGYVRACLKSGGYVISPIDHQHKQSVVRHMLDIDWKLWRSYKYLQKSQSLSVHMLGRLAALREFFKTNISSYLSERKDLKNENEDLFLEMEDEESELSDEFFDFPEPFDDDQLESKEMVAREDGFLCNYKFTLPKDENGDLPNSWSVPEPSLFQIRGETYFKDHKKIHAKTTLMQTIAVDWLRSDKREDNLAARSGSIVQKFAARGCPEFFFIVNFQIPGSTTYNIACYYMTNTPLKDLPLLKKFVEGDDAFRNSRFKLLPHVTKGPWIVKQSASRASLVGQLLKVNYIRGNNYIEADIDVGSSTLARGVASTCLSYFSSLISETAFVIQANTQDELPEHLYGASRLNYLDVSKAFWANP
ncbi:protein ENHANCED DISEASE RESISTANCE 2 [Lactuca sativa]|uniref:START domain-containing protein n=1 Tax=Lactuca sativa TaxID=4236 RepID=A0A9R1XX98_LACSA|nr:protein ENHANCED DISEASE RESISTANCE 2 [Lactuca sativa]KAJ0226714.1 hypothetical protein LSAT_V11C100026100 [Lactuca sativa]